MNKKKRRRNLILYFQQGGLNLVFKIFMCPIHRQLRIPKVETCSPQKDCPTASSVSLVCECSLRLGDNIYLIPCTYVSIVQLALEQHRFELCGSTHTWILFFSKYVIGPPYLWALNPWIPPTTNGKFHPWLVEFTGEESNYEIECLWIFIYRGGPGSNSVWIQRNESICNENWFY